MKRFQFPLERVLELRRIQAEAERRRLEQFIAQRAAVTAQREQIEEEARQLLTYSSIEPAELRARESYSGFLQRREARLKTQLAEVGRRVASQQSKVLEAERRCELLERLKGQRREAWVSELDRELEELAADSFRARLHASRRT